MTSRRIPASMIGLLPTLFSGNYTHDQINSIFLTSGAPENVPELSKTKKVEAWLRLINQECARPLEILGKILESFMDAEPSGSRFSDILGTAANDLDNQFDTAFHQRRDNIKKFLAKDGLQYVRGGNITFGQATPTVSLMQQIKEQGLPAVDIEFRRALDNLDKDPPAACLAAATIIESTLKAYLDKYSIVYKESDTLSDLWGKAAPHIGLRPGDMEDKDLKKIASGMHSIVEGIMNLRNRKSASHGKSDQQMKMKTYKIEPRHARLAVHASHTVAAYVLELMN